MNNVNEINNIVTETEKVKAFSERITAVKSELAKDVVGQTEIIENVIIAIVAGGNVLLEGVPGVGKTRLVRSLGSLLQIVVGEGFLQSATPKHGFTVDGIGGHAIALEGHPHTVIQSVYPEVHLLLSVNDAPNILTGVTVVLVKIGGSSFGHAFGGVVGGGSFGTADHGDANSCDEN